MSSHILAPIRYLAALVRRRNRRQRIPAMIIVQEVPSEAAWEDLKPSECISFEEWQRRMAATPRR